MPGGAPLRTRSEHTSVPAATSTSAPGGPWLTTCNGSRCGTARTVSCQVPAHSGPTRTDTVVVPSMTPWVRSSATTRAAPGWPAQLTADAAGNPVGGLDDGAVPSDGSGLGAAGRDCEGAGLPAGGGAVADRDGSASGGRCGGQPGSAGTTADSSTHPPRTTKGTPPG